MNAMNAMILSLSPEVREAALDLKALRRKIKEAGQRAYEWFPAEANARHRMLCLSLEQSVDEEALSSQQTPPGEAGRRLSQACVTFKGPTLSIGPSRPRPSTLGTGAPKRGRLQSGGSTGADLGMRCSSLPVHGCASATSSFSSTPRPGSSGGMT